MSIEFAKQLITDPSETTLDQLFAGVAGVFWVDWREADEDIIAMAAQALPAEDLAPEWITEKLHVRFRGKLTEVPLAFKPGEQDITLRALNAAIAPDFEIRYVKASHGGDAAAFICLDQAGWRGLQASFGDQVGEAFAALSSDAPLFGPAPATKPAAKASPVDLRALYSQAYNHEQGIGVSQDYVKAVSLYRQAAELANDKLNMFENGSAARCNLADKYEHGLGVAQDYAQAHYWYLKSAEQENHVAQFSLGNMYKDGVGVPRDLDKARAWFAKSAAHGYEDAAAALRALASDA
jgi:hypothetical protein